MAMQILLDILLISLFRHHVATAWLVNYGRSHDTFSRELHCKFEDGRERYTCAGLV